MGSRYRAEMHRLQKSRKQTMPKLDGILETALYTDDMARARAFYEGVLGLAPIFSDNRLTAYGVAGRDVLLIFRRGSATQTVTMPAAPYRATTGRDRCMSRSGSARTSWRNGSNIWPRAGLRSRARPPGRAAAAASISAIPTGTSWSWRRRGCGPSIKT
jgi:catechol 2,3-dioxygenase-like lactoylglutathione lyase family enzyme